MEIRLILMLLLCGWHGEARKGVIKDEPTGRNAKSFLPESEDVVKDELAGWNMKSFLPESEDVIKDKLAKRNLKPSLLELEEITKDGPRKKDWKSSKRDVDSNGYTKGSDGLWYKFHEESVDWDTAKLNCEQEGAHLAIFSSTTTFEYIKSASTHHTGSIWVGGRRDLTSRYDWKWIDGTSVERKYWTRGEPNDVGGKEDCAVIVSNTNGLMFDVDCDDRKEKFFCQKGQPCGKQLVSSPRRIVGGVNAHEGEWPWQIGLFNNAWFGGRRPGCGGTLIRSNVVLTAGHCIDYPNSPSLYRVRVGDHSMTTHGEQEEIVEVKKIMRHEGYKEVTLGRIPLNDVAILILDKHVKLSKFVNVACLPQKNEITDKNCFVTGWGSLRSEGAFPTILQEVQVPIVTKETCSKTVRIGNDGIADGMICAGYHKGGKDSCQGDSGGPLVCRKGDGRFELRGVVSWGHGCAFPQKYGVYADVYFYMNWINQKLDS